MNTVVDLKSKIAEHLGEDLTIGEYPDFAPTSGSVTSADHFLSGIHAALNSLTIRVWKKATVEIEADATSVELPADFIAVEGIYDTYLAQFIPKALFRIGESIISGGSQNAWIDYPNGTISFSNKLSEGGVLYYSANWELPEEDTDALETPIYCLPYLALYGASHCMVRKLAQQAEIRQYATKVDSGNPIMLPAREVSDFLLRRAQIELGALPATQKGISQ